MSKGFTFVELSACLMVIGFLLSGIVQSKQIIHNARVSAAVAQIQLYDIANSVFYDAYGTYPGDATSATRVLPGCASSAAACKDGNGDGRLEASLPGDAQENTQFWVHLFAANLIVDSDGSDVREFGRALPRSKLGQGGFVVGHHDGGPIGVKPAGEAGHYLAILGGIVPGQYVSAFWPAEAANLDSKIDDGNPMEGRMFALLPACLDGQVYADNHVSDCAVAYKMEDW